MEKTLYLLWVLFQSQTVKNSIYIFLYLPIIHFLKQNLELPMAEALPLRRDKPSDLQDPAGEAEILKNSDSRLSPHRDKYRGSAAMEIDDHAAGNLHQ